MYAAIGYGETSAHKVINKLKKSIDYSGNQSATNTQEKLEAAQRKKRECEDELTTITEQLDYYQAEKEKYISEVANTANYKLESIGNNYRSRKRALEQKIRDINDEKIIQDTNSVLCTILVPCGKCTADHNPPHDI